jgi:hypothetical protein
VSKGARLRQPGHKIRRALRRTPDAYFDLVQWLRDRGYANTNKQARALILAKRVKSDSHALGVAPAPVRMPDGKIEMVDTVFPHVPVEFRANVSVEAA